ncbi:ABC transporter substrate-binding protein [Psychromonas ossibalaenae]|uniref:ABC transporter substrate-binding protein n=1 Tax=Psychromonas ossibalaenae TaxID=444922 RepID=UPI000375D229|nr:ABC transporter substrate-binding protein [Psychromonas ossibalaenae]
MKKFIFVILFISSAAWGNDSLKIGCLEGAIGADIFFEILTEACNLSKINCERIRWPSERTLKMAELSEIDGDGPRNPNVEKYYSKLVRVDFNFFDVEFVGFGRNPKIKLNSWSDLEKFSFAYPRGWKIFDKKTPKQGRIVRESPAQLLAMVEKNRIDLILLTKWDGLELVKHSPEINLLPGVLEKMPQYLYLSPNKAYLAPKLIESLKQMRKQGKIKKIINAILEERLKTAA